MFKDLIVDSYFGNRRLSTLPQRTDIKAVWTHHFSVVVTQERIIDKNNFQAGTMLMSIEYTSDNVQYRLCFSTLGRLFTMARSNDYHSGKIKSGALDSRLNQKILSIYSENGYLYVDAGYAFANKYDGPGDDLKKYSIFDRFFSWHIPDELEIDPLMIKFAEDYDKSNS